MVTQGLMSKGAPAGPPVMLYLRIAVVFLALISLVCAAVTIAEWGSQWLGFRAPGFMIFVAVKTFVIYGAIFFIEKKAPQYYMRPVAIGLYVFNMIFWLSAWAWAASWASTLGTVCSFGASMCPGHAAIAAGAAAGAVTWVLSIAHLVFYIRTCLAEKSADRAELGKYQHNTQVPVQTNPLPPQQPVFQASVPQ